jgi:signal transduction histidine kinase
MTVLTRFKRTTLDHIRATCPPEVALVLWSHADVLFADAVAALVGLQLQSMHADLWSRVQRAEDQLTQLDQSKSDFIAIAAHELKTPLTIIEGYAGILGGYGSDDGRLEMIVSGIAQGVTRLNDLVEDIIAIAMIDLRMLQLHLQPVWLVHLLDAVERDLRPLLAERSLYLSIDREAFPTGHTYGDPEFLVQAVFKVIANAVKYTPDGGEITVTCRELSGFVDLMIRDAGIGIAPENLTRIFEPFSSAADVQLHSSSKTRFKGGGAGLGLPIAKGILEAHGGTVWAESPGFDERACPGSIFHLMIPMRADRPGEPSEERTLHLDYRIQQD